MNNFEGNILIILSFFFFIYLLFFFLGGVNLKMCAFTVAHNVESYIVFAVFGDMR